MSLAFTPDDKSLVAVDHDGVLRVWETDAWQEPPREWRVGRPASMALSPDGETIAVGRWDGRTVSLWDFESGEIQRVLGEHVAFGLAFSPDGKNLVSTGLDHNVYVWSLESGLRVRNLSGHTSYVAGVDFSPDGQLLATVGNEGTLRLWRAEELQNIDHHPMTRDSMFQLGKAQIRQQQFVDAETTLRRTLELQRASLPDDHTDIAMTRKAIQSAMRGSRRQPVVSYPPRSLSVNSGKPAEFSVEVDGDGPWSYQWFHNDQAIPGANESSFRIPAANANTCLLYTSPSPRDATLSRMPSSA